MDQAIAEVKASRAHIADLEKQLDLASTGQKQLVERLSTEQGISQKLQQEIDALNNQITLLTDQRDKALAQLRLCEDNAARLQKERDQAQGRVHFWRKVSAVEAVVTATLIVVTVLASKGG